MGEEEKDGRWERQEGGGGTKRTLARTIALSELEKRKGRTVARVDFMPGK